MFEQLGQISQNASSDNTRFFPVASLEDVAIHLQDSEILFLFK